MKRFTRKTSSTVYSLECVLYREGNIYDLELCSFWNQIHKLISNINEKHTLKAIFNDAVVDKPKTDVEINPINVSVSASECDRGNKFCSRLIVEGREDVKPNVNSSPRGTLTKNIQAILT